jgi:hypothetical protein
MNKEAPHPLLLVELNHPAGAPQGKQRAVRVQNLLFF